MAEPTKVEPGKYSKQFPELSSLLGGYFHEDMFYVFDWKAHKPNYKSVIRYIKSIQEPDYLSKKITELREFLKLSREWDEDKLREILHKDLGNCLYAPFFKMTYREFLEGILEILEEPMEKTKSEFIPQMKPDAGWGDDGWMDYVDEETKRMLNLK
ncbi:MAG: hypothetical protein H0X15_13960 [Acidobacteria bacterium]|nr:hypothetical protein [Acidobacteriota bacterium]MBA4185783.1 hypothetical protein [Acidobacteriota bacterium]